MTFNDCLKLVNELKSTVGGKEFQAFITLFAKKTYSNRTCAAGFVNHVCVHE